MKKCIAFLLTFMVVAAAIPPTSGIAVTKSNFFFLGNPPDLSNREEFMEWQREENLLAQSLNTYAEEIFDISGLTLDFCFSGDTEASAQTLAEESIGDTLDIYCAWLPDKTEDNIGIAISGKADEVINDEDIANIRNSVNIGEEYSSYQRALNLLKALTVAVFNGGEFEYPKYSYVNEFLSDPEKIELNGPPLGEAYVVSMTDDESQQKYYELDEKQEREIKYVLDTIRKHTEIVPAVYVYRTKDNILEEKERFAEFLETDTENVLYIFYNADNGGYEVEFTAGENVGLSDEQQAEIAEAFAKGEDNYSHMLNGAVALAETLFENRGLELPASFAEAAEAEEKDYTTVIIVAAVAVVVAAAAVAGIIATRKKAK